MCYFCHMIDIEITINKLEVYNEVAKKSSYTGSKMIGDEDAYARIFTTDEDRLMLESFWLESCSVATEALKEFITQVSNQVTGHGIDLSSNYVVSFAMSNAWDTKLQSSLTNELFAFFTYHILSKWYGFVNKPEAESYATQAQDALADAMNNAYYRKKPTRINPV